MSKLFVKMLSYLKSCIEKPKIFILQTDASNVGVGSVLSQADDSGEERPVAYASRKLLSRETRYAAVEKECLAVVEGIRSFHAYLEGRSPN